MWTGIMEDLRRLGNEMPLPQEPLPLVEVSQVVTQLKAGAWEKQLQELPNRECAEFVFHGLRERFHIGFD